MRKAAPAYQEYARDTLADERFLLADMATRGVLWTLKMLCWSQGSIPADEAKLARLCGMEVEAFGEAWSAVSEFFAESPNDSSRLTHSDLEEQREGRLVVVGDADFARNRHVAKVYNADFFLNIANWLVGEEGFITIDRRVPRASMAQMTRGELATFQYLSIFVLPEGILLLGILQWWRRRSR